MTRQKEYVNVKNIFLQYFVGHDLCLTRSSDNQYFVLQNNDWYWYPLIFCKVYIFLPLIFLRCANMITFLLSSSYFFTTEWIHKIFNSLQKKCKKDRVNYLILKFNIHPIYPFKRLTLPILSVVKILNL